VNGAKKMAPPLSPQGLCDWRDEVKTSAKRIAANVAKLPELFARVGNLTGYQTSGSVISISKMSLREKRISYPPLLRNP
jgi:hypothetical protein